MTKWILASKVLRITTNAVGHSGAARGILEDALRQRSVTIRVKRIVREHDLGPIPDKPTRHYSKAFRVSAPGAKIRLRKRFWRRLIGIPELRFDWLRSQMVYVTDLPAHQYYNGIGLLSSVTIRYVGYGVFLLESDVRKAIAKYKKALKSKQDKQNRSGRKKKYNLESQLPELWSQAIRGDFIQRSLYTEAVLAVMIEQAYADLDVDDLSPKIATRRRLAQELMTAGILGADDQNRAT